MKRHSHPNEDKRHRRPGRRMQLILRRHWLLCLCCTLPALCIGAWLRRWWLSGGFVDEDGIVDRRRRRLRPLGASRVDKYAEAMVLRGFDVHEAKVSNVVHLVQGKVVAVMDNVISENERRRVADRYIKLTGKAAQDGWHREKASDMSLDHNAMAKNMPFEECDSEAMSVIRTAAPHFYKECNPDFPMWVTRCSIYMQTFIDIDEAHEDRSHDELAFGVTAIWYPHQFWSSAWGGETTFLSGNGNAKSDLLLPVLPMPRRLLMFDSSIPHMAKPTTPIAQPFDASTFSHLSLPTTRTSGNRFTFVLRTMCGRQSVPDLHERFDADHNQVLSRAEVISLFRYLQMERLDGALQRLARIAQGKQQFTVDHLKAFFDIRYEEDPPRHFAGLDNNTVASALADHTRILTP